MWRAGSASSNDDSGCERMRCVVWPGKSLRASSRERDCSSSGNCSGFLLSRRWRCCTDSASRRVRPRFCSNEVTAASCSAAAVAARPTIIMIDADINSDIFQIDRDCMQGRLQLCCYESKRIRNDRPFFFCLMISDAQTSTSAQTRVILEFLDAKYRAAGNRGVGGRRKCKLHYLSHMHSTRFPTQDTTTTCQHALE